jgi:RNA polymerase sigma-70 factor (ECF subfamily)
VFTVEAPRERIAERLAALAEEARAGDREALELLLRELRPLVVRTARLVVGPGTWAAEDAAQEALLDVTLGVQGLRESAAVRAWALQLTVRRALKVARRERLRLLPMSKLDPELMPAQPGDERREALRSAFAALPPRLRAVAALRLYVGLSESETAAVMGRPVGTVKSQLNEARRRLAESLRVGGYRPITAPSEEDRNG